jgi:hypothetical protein
LPAGSAGAWRVKRDDGRRRLARIHRGRYR